MTKSEHGAVDRRHKYGTKQDDKELAGSFRLNDDIDAKASLIQNTLMTEETHSEEPMHSVLQQIKHKLSEWQQDDDQEQKIEKNSSR